MVLKQTQAMFSPTGMDRHLPSPVINVPVRKGTPVRASSAIRERLVQGEYYHPEPSRVSGARSLETYPPPEKHHYHHPNQERLVELECDYDTSATELYELLESSDWDRARTRCRTHPEEVRTWITRRDKSQQVRWKLLPLHAAIIFQAPIYVVTALIERYPTAASRRDDQGMLPLHLAFRHKQEDEELLEHLLVQNPTAVTVRDRRDRTPLEHGRESRFSAKLMRLYAEAMVTACAHGGSMQKHPHLSHTDTFTANTESLTHSGNHTHASQIARLEAEHEAKITVLKADHDYQIQVLQAKYEDRIQAIQEKTNADIRNSQLLAESEKQALINQHNGEVAELRDLLTRQINKDRAMTATLQKEVSMLQEHLSEAKTQAEVLADRYHALVNDNELLRNFFEQIKDDQAAIQEIALKQQEYLKAARNMRHELIQTLIKQEDNDGENDRLQGTRMMDLADRVQRRIDDYLETNLAGRIQTVRPVSDRRGLSRIEVERADQEQDADRIYSDHQGQTEVQAYYVVKGVEHNPNAEDENQEPQPAHEHPQPHQEDEEDDYGEVRILGDEISAITENSAY